MVSLLYLSPVSRLRLYIGSFGAAKGTVLLNLGRLQIYVRYNPFAWNKGACLYEKDTLRLYQQVVVLIAGPVASLLVSTVCGYLTFTFDLHGSIKLTLVATVFSSLIDLGVNINPSNRLIKLEDGGLAFNDGRQLKLLFTYGSLYRKYWEVVTLYEQQLYRQAAEGFNNLIQGGFTEDFVYREAISAYLQVHEYQQAKMLDEQLGARFDKNATDYAS
jgi:hypothetical protein